MLVLAVFLLVACRRFLACSVSLRSTLLVLLNASLLFCPFQFIRFLSYAALLLFVLVVAFFVSRSLLFLPFSPLSPFTGLWVFFPLARLSSFSFSVSLLWYFYASANLGFSFLLSVSLSYHLPLRSVPVLFSLLRLSFLACVTFRGVRYISVLPVWPFVGRALSVCSCSCLVFVALSRALFSHWLS